MARSGRIATVLAVGWALAILEFAIPGMTKVGPIDSLGDSLGLSMLGAFIGAFTAPFIDVGYDGQPLSLAFRLGVVGAVVGGAAAFAIGLSGKPVWWRNLIAIAGVVLWINGGTFAIGVVA